MAVFTSYFAKANEIPEFYTFYSIARSTPSWVQRSLIHLEKLKPSWQLIDAYKTNRINWDQYRIAYKFQVECYLEDILKSLPPNAILLCWEAPHLPCHRHLISYWANTKHRMSIREWE